MKNQNFYMRVISLLLVVLAVLFYNSSMKAQANEKEIETLTDKVDTLQEQQNELLSALETSYVNRMQNQAASAGSGSSDADAAGDDKTTDTSDGNVSDADAEDTATADSDNVYKDGTYTGEAEGYGGTIQVEVTLTGDEITSINVVSAPGEDSAYLSQAESVIDSILSAQGTDVDTVSGATFSSTGILNAVDAALGERRKTHEKKTAGGKADACGNTAGIFYCRPVSVFHSLCRNQIDLSCHCGRSAGGVEFLSDCNGSASDLYLLFRKTFLRICVYIRIFRRCRI